MRKRIGIFTGEPSAEYQRYMISSVMEEGKKRGYDVFALCSFGGYGDNVLYAEGEKGIMYLPDLSTFDGIVVGEDTFDIDSMEDELANLLAKNAACPVVYLRRYREEFYSVMVSGREPMANMTRHFVEHHGFTDICFMQGKMSYPDAQERYQGFVDVMTEAGIPITEHMVFEGDYWRNKGATAVDWFMEGRDTYPQAIICSNDYMALSVCDELKKRGVRVPEDVCVSGYDNTVEARRNFPSISSVWVHFETLGTKAVEMIDNIYNGKPQEKVETIGSELMLYSSCGCGHQIKVDDWQEVLDKIYKQERNQKRLTFMAIECQDAFGEADYMRLVAKYFTDTCASKGYLCMCADERVTEEEQAGFFTSEMVLKRVFDKNGNVTVCDERFKRKYLLPPYILEREDPNGYMFLSIHYKNKYYGYMVLIFEGNNWIDSYSQAYLSNIANVIDASELHKQIASLEEIRNLYLSDPLTGIANRRGFEKQLRALYEQRGQSDKFLSIVSIDMDGLKYINDNFGHAEGDVALCALAEVLKTLVGPEELCARVGGDEFAVILLGDTVERHLQFEEQFDAAMKAVNEREKKPYELRASIGICCITEEKDLSLMSCIQKADRAMYACKSMNKALKNRRS